MSARFAQLCRPNDLIGRLGGDEFALLLPDTESREAERVAGRLCDAIGATPVETSAGPSSLTATVGVASLESGLATFDDLLAAADLRMLASKTSATRPRLVRLADPHPERALS